MLIMTMVTPDDHPQCGVPQKNKNEHKYNDSGNLSSAIASNNGEDKDDVMSLPYKTEDDALRSSSSLWAPNPGTGLRSFPYQLHRMLDDAEFKGFEHVVSWQDRKSFKVHDRHLFATKILPIYFEGQTQYKSFQRQLNIYNFTRLTKGGPTEQGGYSHEFFVQGKPTLCRFMVRIKVKNNNNNNNNNTKMKGRSRSSSMAALSYCSSATSPSSTTPRMIHEAAAAAAAARRSKKTSASAPDLSSLVTPHHHNDDPLASVVSSPDLSRQQRNNDDYSPAMTMSSSSSSRISISIRRDAPPPPAAAAPAAKDHVELLQSVKNLLETMQRTGPSMNAIARQRYTEQILQLSSSTLERINSIQKQQQANEEVDCFAATGDGDFARYYYPGDSTVHCHGSNAGGCGSGYGGFASQALLNKPSARMMVSDDLFDIDSGMMMMMDGDVGNLDETTSFFMVDNDNNNDADHHHHHHHHHAGDHAAPAPSQQAFRWLGDDYF